MKHKFTLVELMVVIGIIAILGAILLPVLSKARDKAIQNECANNMRQLAMAEIAYAADNEQRFLGGVPDGGSSGTAAEKMRRTWVSALYDYVKESKVFLCDADENDDKTENYGVAGGEFAVSYLNNAGLPANKKRYIAETPSRVITYGPRLHEKSDDLASCPLGYAAETTMIWDNFDFDDDKCRHIQVSNFAFLDGHTEALTTEIFKSRHSGSDLTKFAWANLE